MPGGRRRLAGLEVFVAQAEAQQRRFPARSE
jgi:hypothetical protein